MPRVLCSLLTAIVTASLFGEISDPFHITGVISYVRSKPDRITPVIAIQNPTNALIVSLERGQLTGNEITPGMRVDCRGFTRTEANGASFLSASSCVFLGRQPPPVPANTGIQELLSGQFDFRLTQFSGTLRDVAVSETAPFWVILVVCDRNNSIFVSVPVETGTVARLYATLGLRITACGVCVPTDPSNRLACGRTFKVASEKDIQPIESRQILDGLPDISSIRTASPAEILSLGRHSAEGRILAVWGKSHALLKTAAGHIVGIELQEANLPQFDECIRVVGLPESDLFRINLIHATWSHVSAPRQMNNPATEAKPRDVMPLKSGYSLVNSDYHGKALSMSGIVRSISDDDSLRFYLDCGNTLVPVDFHVRPETLADVSVGCTVRVSGTCVIQQEERHGLSAFPRLKDFFLVLRTPDDLHVLSRPSWWTPARLLVVIGALVLALGGIFIWNRSLVNIADRRSHELLKEQLAHVESELKIGERTRLSVELHDTLSQNLLGASMEINTVEQLVTDKEALAHLGIASKTLRASRDELRNCLWDLRSQALEESDMDAAIRKTLEPYVCDINLMIRFNVPRTLFTDNTAHALMRIIRELVLNAIRHGHAKTVKIAGSRENGQLLFSVRDDGCGFAPSGVPGIGEGHFGLQGVRERLRLLKGTVSIESTSGAGTYVSARFPLPDDETERI